MIPITIGYVYKPRSTHIHFIQCEAWQKTIFAHFTYCQKQSKRRINLTFEFDGVGDQNSMVKAVIYLPIRRTRCQRTKEVPYTRLEIANLLYFSAPTRLQGASNNSSWCATQSKRKHCFHDQAFRSSLRLDQCAPTDKRAAGVKLRRTEST